MVKRAVLFVVVFCLVASFASAATYTLTQENFGDLGCGTVREIVTSGTNYDTPSECATHPEYYPAGEVRWDGDHGVCADYKTLVAGDQIHVSEDIVCAEFVNWGIFLGFSAGQPDDIVIDCFNPTTQGKNKLLYTYPTGGYSAISLEDNSGVEIKNCDLDGWATGISISANSPDYNIHDNIIQNSRDIGIDIDYQAPGGNIVNNQILNTGDGAGGLDIGVDVGLNSGPIFFASNSVCGSRDYDLSCPGGSGITGSGNKIGDSESDVNECSGGWPYYGSNYVYCTDISSCSEEITSPGTYSLAGDLDCSIGRPAILVRSGDVEIDCNGHDIIGPGTTLNAISINPGLQNVEIRNCNIRGWDKGITSTGMVTGLAMTGGSLTSNTFGISLVDPNGLSLSGVLLSGNGHGVALTNALNTQIESSIFDSNGEGIGLNRPDGLNVVTSSFTSHTENAIYIQDGADIDIGGQDVSQKNIFTANPVAIYLDTDQGQTGNIFVRWNDILQSTEIGLNLQGLSSSDIFSVAGNTFSSNVLGLKMRLADMAGAVTENTFVDNTDTGLLVESFGTTTVAGLSLWDNVFERNLGGGLKIIGSEDVDVSGNIFRQNSLFGLDVHDSLSTDLVNVRIKNNQIHDTLGDGMLVKDAGPYVFEGNEILRSSGKGIDLINNDGEITLVDNVVNNNLIGIENENTNLVANTNELCGNYDGPDLKDFVCEGTSTFSGLDNELGFIGGDGVTTCTDGNPVVDGQDNFACGITEPSCGMELSQDDASYVFSSGITCPGSDFEDVSAVTISGDNIVLSCADNLIVGSGSPSAREYVGIKITGDNVRVEDCDVSGFNRGIEVFNAQDVVLHNNDLHQNTRTGVFAHSSFGASPSIDTRRLSISKNNIYGNVLSGVSFLKVSQSLIEDNKIYSNRPTSTTNPSPGISLSENSGGNTIRLNRIYDNGVGVDFEAPSFENTLEGNYVYENLEGGVFLVGTSSTDLVDNRIYDNIGEELRLENVIGTKLTDNVICDYNLMSSSTEFDFYCLESSTGIDPQSSGNEIGFSVGDVQSCDGGLPTLGTHYVTCSYPYDVASFVAEVDTRYNDETTARFNFDRDSLVLLTWEDVLAFIQGLYAQE